MPKARDRRPAFGVTGLIDGMSPRQSAAAGAGQASAAARTTAASAPRRRLSGALRERVRLAELRDVRRLVNLARDAADCEDAGGLVAGVELALRPASNAHDGVRIEREALPLDVHLAPTSQHEVDLLLPVPGMV